MFVFCKLNMVLMSKEELASGSFVFVLYFILVNDIFRYTDSLPPITPGSHLVLPLHHLHRGQTWYNEHRLLRRNHPVLRCRRYYDPQFQR